MSKKADDFKYFWTDAELYFLWQFTNDSYLPFDEDNILRNDLLLPKKGQSIEWYLKRLSEYIDIDKSYEFHIYSDSDKSKFLDTVVRLHKYSKTEQKSIHLAVQRIQAWTFTYSDLVCAEDVLYVGLYWDIYLAKKKDQPTLQASLKQSIDRYILWYINWELLVTEKNYFNFSINQEIFVKMIQDMNALNTFWRNFIVSSNSEFSPFQRDQQLLFVHTVYAMEYLWYLQVLNISRSFEWSGVDFETVFHVNIIPNELLRGLVYKEFQKENPETVITWYDWKTWILTFAGKEIIIGKSGKETDARLLLWSLMKAWWDQYMHNDEIYEDWGFNEADIRDAPKKKIYFAWIGINKLMELEAWVDDFLEVTLSKARINPKYRKID